MPPKLPPLQSPYPHRASAIGSPGVRQAAGLEGGLRRSQPHATTGADGPHGRSAGGQRPPAESAPSSPVPCVLSPTVYRDGHGASSRPLRGPGAARRGRGEAAPEVLQKLCQYGPYGSCVLAGTRSGGVVVKPRAVRRAGARQTGGRGKGGEVQRSPGSGPPRSESAIGTSAKTVRARPALPECVIGVPASIRVRPLRAARRRGIRGREG